MRLPRKNSDLPRNQVLEGNSSAVNISDLSKFIPALVVYLACPGRLVIEGTIASGKVGGTFALKAILETGSYACDGSINNLKSLPKAIWCVSFRAKDQRMLLSNQATTPPRQEDTSQTQ